MSCVFSTEIIRKDELKNIELTLEPDENIEQNKLHMVYKPKIDPQNKGLAGLEALIRSNHSVTASCHRPL
jgi:EAL domain-containing protein (putative c-di-GMP-specific phosphodiesterase class I)